MSDHLGRPRFIAVEEALAWHEILMSRYGGKPGLRDRALLESALAMPQQSISGQYAHQFPFEMGAAYAFHLDKNHPFVDGNKRIALWCCGSFLRMNGWTLESDGVLAADQILALISGEVDKAGFAQWLKDRSRPRPSLELRDFFAQLRGTDMRSWLKAAGAQSQQEIDATVAEAQEVIPLVRSLLAASIEAAQAGDEPSAARLKSQAMTLISIYRLAEDMGYDW
ncbi:MAG: type II toxin-antitoxin system death-on-curing family toxin [Phycisphaerales bacterium]